jgi:hypothetical protein
LLDTVPPSLHQADHRIASPPVTSLLVILLVLAAGAALTAQLVWWLSGRPGRERVPPPLVYPLHTRVTRQPEPPAQRAPAPAPVVTSLELPLAAQSSTESVGTFSQPVLSPVPESDDGGADATVQFVRPGDEALQLLPARLEVLSGMSTKQVIRFVRIPGKPAEMILGRDRASSPQHVTLTSRTVSRRHARVTYDNGRWLVTNLSHTNPVVVNDHAIADFEGPRPLLDGDRIELGDVVLRFCTS